MVRLCDIVVSLHGDAINGRGSVDGDGGLRGGDGFGVAGEFQESLGVVGVEDGIEGVEGDAGLCGALAWAV